MRRKVARTASDQNVANFAALAFAPDRVDRHAQEARDGTLSHGCRKRHEIGHYGVTTAAAALGPYPSASRISFRSRILFLIAMS